MQELCQLYGRQKSRTTVYHPQGNGACELGSLTETDQAQWPDQLPALLQVYNNTIHGTTKMTAHYVVF